MTEQTAEEILCDEVLIKTSGMLIDVIKDLKELIRVGKLKQVDGNVLIDTIPFLSSFKQDIIFMYFESVPGGTKYFLNCETYHGLGGLFAKGTPDERYEAHVNRIVKERTNKKNE